MKLSVAFFFSILIDYKTISAHRGIWAEVLWCSTTAPDGPAGCVAWWHDGLVSNNPIYMKPCFLVCTPYWTTYEKSKNIQFVRALHIPIFFFNMLFRHVKERLQLLYIFLHIWLWSIGPNHKCKQAIDQSMFCKQMQSCPGKQLFCKRMQIFCERMQSF